MASVVTCDGKLFLLSDEVKTKCKMLEDMFEDTGTVYAATLPNIHSDEMKRIIDYIENGTIVNENMGPLLVACDFLNCEELLDEGCRMVAQSLQGRSMAEIRAMFGLDNTGRVTF